MDVIHVDNQEVIKCPHCGGSGVCQRATRQWDGEKTTQMICDVCGSGVAVRSSFAHPKPPGCKVCGGRGFNRV